MMKPHRKNTKAGKGTKNEGIKTVETNDPNMERHGKLMPRCHKRCQSQTQGLPCGVENGPK